jgi:hypothetical protein
MITSVLVIALAVVGRIVIFSLKETQTVVTNNGVSSEFSQSMDLRGGHSYKIVVTMSDAGPGRAVVGGTVRVFVDLQLFETLTLTAQDEMELAEELMYADDTAIAWLYPENGSALYIEGVVEEGHNWNLRIYEDLPEYTDSLDQVLVHLGFYSFAFLVLCGLGYVWYRNKDAERATAKSDQQDDKGLALESSE